MKGDVVGLAAQGIACFSEILSQKWQSSRLLLQTLIMSNHFLCTYSYLRDIYIHTYKMSSPVKW